jgi:hypothetical protein
VAFMRRSPLMPELDLLQRKNRATRKARSIRTFFVQDHQSFRARGMPALPLRTLRWNLEKKLSGLESPFPRQARKSGASTRRRPASSRDSSGVGGPEGERLRRSIVEARRNPNLSGRLDDSAARRLRLFAGQPRVVSRIAQRRYDP